MAGQKLFTDAPKAMGGGVTPVITSDITQKSAADDPNTMEGYKARLAAQQAAEQAGYQSKRGLQLQWEEEDKQRQAKEMMNLDRLRREAFNKLYAPQALADIKLNREIQRQQPYIMNANPSLQYRLGANNPWPSYTDPASGAQAVGGMLVGGQWHNVNGAMVPGPDPNAVQGRLNQMWGNAQLAKGMQNVNPYYQY
jgi:hypothetical protein